MVLFFVKRTYLENVAESEQDEKTGAESETEIEEEE